MVLFVILAFSQIVDGLRHVLIGVLRGLFDTRFPMYINLLVIWIIGVPLAYFMAFMMHLGVIGIALGTTTGLLIGAFVLLYRWHGLSTHT